MKYESITDMFYLTLYMCSQSAYKNLAELISAIDHWVSV